jgi:hypothetical protein
MQCFLFLQISVNYHRIPFIGKHREWRTLRYYAATTVKFPLKEWSKKRVSIFLSFVHCASRSFCCAHSTVTAVSTSIIDMEHITRYRHHFVDLPNKTCKIRRRLIYIYSKWVKFVLYVRGHHTEGLFFVRIGECWPFSIWSCAPNAESEALLSKLLVEYSSQVFCCFVNSCGLSQSSAKWIQPFRKSSFHFN